MLGVKRTYWRHGPDFRVLANSDHLSIEMALMVCAIDGAITIATHLAVGANVGIPIRGKKEYDSDLETLVEGLSVGV